VPPFVSLNVIVQHGPGDAERRRRRSQNRLEFLRRLEEDAAGPPPFQVTLADARAKWPEWEAAYNERCADGRRVATDKLGPVVAGLLADVYLPPLPAPTDLVVYALDLECGHEAFRLAKRADKSTPAPDRARCPIFWSCQLNDGRNAVRYIEAGEPEDKHVGLGLTRWSVALACGHAGEVLCAEADESRVGDFLVCQTCGRDDPDFDIEIVALGDRLPNVVVQHWKVQLSCGHPGTDHFIPVEFQDDPAAYRAGHPHRSGLRCIDPACHERKVRGVRRLGVLGKIRTPKPTPPTLDRVALAARDVRQRWTKEERQALIRELQESDR